MDVTELERFSSQYGTLSNFDVGKKIGKGQFAEVFRATCKHDGRVFALKKLVISDLKEKKVRVDCLKEVKLLEKLHHTNIIRYFCSFVEDSDVYIVLELAEAGDLARLILHHRNTACMMPERTIFKYFVQMARGLAHMHSERIMHRDIKPANVFVSQYGIVKLGDLGLGRLFSATTWAAKSRLGSPHYMSPEMFEESYEFRSDIWSLGCVLYEMAALQAPFFGDTRNLYSLLQKIKNCSYPPIPSDGYSAEMKNLVGRCIVAKPESRLTADQVVTIAEQILSRFT